jgi:hypothetical protein
MAVKTVSFTYELRDVTHLGGLVGYGGILKGWYMQNSRITMDDHIDSMRAQGWPAPHIIDMPGGQKKVAAFTKYSD